MRNFIYLIASSDDFGDTEDLQNAYLDGVLGDYNASIIPVSLDEACKVKGYDTLGEIATVIARGEAMSDGWCLDDTVSILLEA
jgi:hypothetical protein